MQGMTHIGKVTRLHGFKGELSLKIFQDHLTYFDTLDCVFLELRQKPVPHFIEAVRYTTKGFALVFFEDVDTEQKAERLRGAKIWVRDEDIPDEVKDAQRLEDLIGYVVHDANQGEIGEVQDVADHPGNAFLILDMPQGEVLIPYSDGIIRNVDDQQKRIDIEAPEGLISLNFD